MRIKNKPKNSGVINNLGKNAKKLRIYGLENCKDVDLKNSSNFYGAIYTPEAKVTVHSSADFYGSIIGNEYEQKEIGDFFYDAALRESKEEDAAIQLTIKRWREY